ncbi:MAG: hypothetical protein RR444_07515, partial [Oscillospiraceae bacterium]
YRQLKDDGEIDVKSEKQTYLNVDTLLEHLPVKEINTNTYKLDYDDKIDSILDDNLQAENIYKDEIERNLDGHDLIIYEIPKRGTRNQGTKYNKKLEEVEEVDYQFCKLICNYCNKKEIYCIVYTKGRIKPLEDSFYTSISNYKPNLIQTATTILNLMI